MKLKHLLIISLLLKASASWGVTANQEEYGPKFVAQLGPCFKSTVLEARKLFEEYRNDLKGPTHSNAYEKDVIQSIINLKQQFIEKSRCLTGLVVDGEGLIATARLRVKAKFHEVIKHLFQECHHSLKTAISTSKDSTLSEKFGKKQAQTNQQLELFNPLMDIYRADEQNFSLEGAGRWVPVLKTAFGEYIFSRNKDLVFLTVLKANRGDAENGVHLLQEIDELLNRYSSPDSLKAEKQPLNYGPFTTPSLEKLEQEITDDLTPLDLLKFMHAHNLKVSDLVLQQVIDTIDDIEKEILEPKTSSAQSTDTLASTDKPVRSAAEAKEASTTPVAIPTPPEPSPQTASASSSTSSSPAATSMQPNTSGRKKAHPKNPNFIESLNTK